MGRQIKTTMRSIVVYTVSMHESRVRRLLAFRRRFVMRAIALVAAIPLCTGVVSDVVIADESEQQPETNAFGDSRVRTGFRISPVDLNLRGKNPALVGLGSYIVNAAGACNDCHTFPAHLPGGDPFMGEPEIINAQQFLAGGRPFGPLISPNITPDEHGRPAGLTFEEFESLMRTGRDPESGDVLQVMPWNIYGKLTDRDLRAIYEYLRAIPSLPDNSPPSP
jgi:hypothetical protein